MAFFDARFTSRRRPCRILVSRHLESRHRVCLRFLEIHILSVRPSELMSAVLSMRNYLHLIISYFIIIYNGMRTRTLVLRRTFRTRDDDNFQTGRAYYYYGKRASVRVHTIMRRAGTHRYYINRWRSISAGNRFVRHMTHRAPRALCVLISRPIVRCDTKTHITPPPRAVITYNC